jgi:hypothetical protein
MLYFVNDNMIQAPGNSGQNGLKNWNPNWEIGSDHGERLVINHVC